LLPYKKNNDIQGEDAPEDALHPAVTRFKALYDDTHLYIAAVLRPYRDNDVVVNDATAEVRMPTEAHFVERNSPIYQKDSDFEVFIDPEGSCHQYKEFEMNAINTVWNLMLDKPYWDGGVKHSGRVAKPGDPDYYEVYQQKSAVQVVVGKVNDYETWHGALWTVELAFSYEDIYAFVEKRRNLHERSAPVPRKGDFWRVNFSRVEWQGKINWTWQRQFHWCPKQETFRGFVDMHLPDSWAHLFFSGETAPSTTTRGLSSPSEPSLKETPRDPTWPIQLAASTLYYAEHYHKERTGSFTSDELQLVLPREIMDPFEITITCSADTNDTTSIEDDVKSWFLATVRNPVDGTQVSITEDCLLTVINGS